MDVALLVEQLPAAQTRALIERTSRLGCWPHDVIVDRHPHDAPAGAVVVIAGVRKGRPRTLEVTPEGGVTVRT